jgi:uncharacterized protein
MTTYLSVFLVLVAGTFPVSASEPPGSEAWYGSIAGKVPTGDAQGHGPDVGSDEWKSVVELKLGVRGKADVPRRDSGDGCRYIDQVISARAAAPGDTGKPASAAAGPSYACDKVEPGSIEALICEDTELSALDRQLSDVYAAASEKASNEQPPQLKAEQRGWVKGRNECWKSGDKKECIRDEYVRRIAELQARYRLVPGNGPVRYACDGNAANEVVVTFFETEPPTLIAERGDSVSMMYLQPSASGTRSQGRNETFWEHQGEAGIQWGYGAAEMRCKKNP